MKGSTNTLVTQTSRVGSAAYPNYNLHTWVHSSLRNPNATYLSSIFCQTRSRTPQLVASAAASLKRLSSPSALWAFPETPQGPSPKPPLLRSLSDLSQSDIWLFFMPMACAFSFPVALCKVRSALLAFIYLSSSFLFCFLWTLPFFFKVWVEDWLFLKFILHSL